MVNFELDIESYNEIKEFSILKYNELLSDDIKKLIYFFNEEYNWDGMFVFDDVRSRIKNGHHLFILYYGNECIGYVFYEPRYNNEFYLYNLYVTNKIKRPTYSAQWFVNKSIGMLPNPISKISCICEDWNSAAHNVFKLNGFKTKKVTNDDDLSKK
jgi:hypothetical protein